MNEAYTDTDGNSLQEGFYRDKDDEEDLVYITFENGNFFVEDIFAFKKSIEPLYGTLLTKISEGEVADILERITTKGNFIIDHINKNLENRLKVKTI